MPQADDELVRMRDSLAGAADNQRLQAELSTTTALALLRQAMVDSLEKRLAGPSAGDQQPSADGEAQQPRTELSADDSSRAASFATVQLSGEDMAPLAAAANGARDKLPITKDTQLLQHAEVPQRTARRDPLTVIHGIGPAYERSLFDAGVSTFEALAALTSEQVRAIIAPQRWQEIDTPSWIAEARQRAQKKAEQ